MFLRLMLLQSTWSFERMQGLGFAYALEPWLERVYPDPMMCRAALERHTEYFNTQPYVASLILGLVCALEENAAALPEADRAAAYERLRALKKTMSAALAGLGDSFFWSALRPAAAAVSIAAAMTALRAGLPRPGLWMAGAYLASYNAPALWLRWRGLTLGYEWRERLPVMLKGFEVQRRVRLLRVAGTALALTVFALAAATSEPGRALLGGLGLAAFWAAYLILPDRVTALRLYGGGCAAGFVASMAGWL